MLIVIIAPPTRLYAAGYAVDQAFAAGEAGSPAVSGNRLQREVLSGQYDTTAQALSSIDNGLNEFYRTNYSEVLATTGRD